MEIEIKLNVGPAIEGGPGSFLTRLASLPSLAGLPLGPARQVHIHDVYYDTSDGALAAIRAGFRKRTEPGCAFVTLKINQVRNGALTRREEFEEPLAQDQLDRVLGRVVEQVGPGPFPLQDLAEGRACGTLIPVLTVRTTRLARDVGTVAELALDVVEYPDLMPDPFYDVEVEAKGGPGSEWVFPRVEEALYSLAGGALTHETMSKLERGIRLKQQRKS